MDGPQECREFLVRRNTIPSASATLFRKDVYERVGGADEDLVFCGDWKTWAAMALTGGRIEYIGEPLNYHRFNETNVTSRNQRLGTEAIEYLKVVRWILQRVTPTDATRGKVCDDLFSLWHPKVLTSGIPLSLRWAILADARAVDRNAVRKLLHSALRGLRLTISRRCRSLRFRF